jgi:hypothetical protein
MMVVTFMITVLTGLRKENRGDWLVEVLQGFTGFVVVLPARFNGLRFGLEFADLDQGEIVTLVQYGISLGCVVCVMRFHGLPPYQ